MCTTCHHLFAIPFQVFHSGMPHDPLAQRPVHSSCHRRAPGSTSSGSSASVDQPKTTNTGSGWACSEERGLRGHTKAPKLFAGSDSPPRTACSPALFLAAGNTCLRPVTRVSLGPSRWSVSFVGSTPSWWVACSPLTGERKGKISGNEKAKL